MFRTAAKKIAHNSTLPVLGGNKDLRSLQELITAEKAVLNSLQKLGADIAKASEALKVWGQGEGDDLGDTLTASCLLSLHFADALSTYANHEVAVRDHMKSVRTREERLDDLRRRRKSIQSEADSAERKLSKMGPDNKNLQVQTDHLNKLRDEIRIMDTDIMAEEASLGDYKRSSAKAWMGLKFGGLAECCEKGLVVAEMGKLVITEIPMDKTEPGLPRAVYQGYARTESFVADGRRAISEVIFSPDPNPDGLPLLSRPAYSPELPSIPMSQRRQSGLSQFGPAGDNSRRASMSRSSVSMPDDPRSGQVLRSPTMSGYGSFPQPPQMLFSHPNRQSLSYEQLQSSTPPPSGDTAEFGALPPSERYSPRANSMQSPEDRERVASPRGGRFATFPVKAAGPRPPPGARDSHVYGAQPREDDRPPSLDIEQPSDSFSSSVAEALGTQFESENARQPPTLSAPGTNARDTKRRSMESDRRSYTPPPPMYSTLIGPPQFQSSENDNGADVQLAYMSNAESEHDAPPSQSDREDRRVNFEESQDPEMGLPNTRGENASSAIPDREAGDMVAQQSDTSHGNLAESSQTSHTESEERGSEQSASGQPSGDDVSVNDEKSLNAAAAREVSRELDALMFNVNPPPPTDRIPSPLQPPQAPFTRRAVSPRPSVETSATQPMSPRMGPHYVRERDRSLASPTSISSASTGDHAQPPPSAGTSRFSADNGFGSNALPAINIARTSPSPSPSAISNSTPYRTPPEYMTSPIGTPTASALYNLSSTVTGSGTSLTGGSGKISAAAFRRQQMRSPSTPVLDNVSGAVDTGPLIVKKRPLPQSPGGTQSPWVGQGPPRAPSVPPVGSTYQDVDDVPRSRYRSASAAHSRDGGAGSRMSQSSGPLLKHPERDGGNDDDFDVISAYTSGPDTGGVADDRYGQVERIAKTLPDKDTGALR